MTDKPGSEKSIAGSDVPTEGLAAEAKRLAARRKFLLGGAAALPLIVTLGTKEAWAASAAVCQSLNMSYDKKYVKRRVKEEFNEDQAREWNGRGQYPRGLAASLYCDPGQRWT